jgi:predicted ATP-dependent protease
MAKELSAEKLRRECDPNLMQCETTRGLTPLEQIIGQERALRALKFGLGIKERGFNIYVAGYPGTGRTTAVKNFLEELAKTKPVPPDWCYVNNFSNEYEPKAMKLPSGRGRDFQRDMKAFVQNVRSALPKAFESEDYATKRDATIKVLESQRKELVDHLNAEAQRAGFIIETTPIGLLLIPVIKGRPISGDELMALSPKIRDEIQKKKEQLESDLRTAMRQFADMDRKIHEELGKLNRDVALYSIGHFVADLTDKYKDVTDVTEYLKDVQNDILSNLPEFIKGPEAAPQVPFQIPWAKEVFFRKYEVNVVVDNSNVKGAPVVMGFNPTYQNLFGRVEKEAQFGALITDFTMIRAGSLHRANGGYLILQVEELLRNPFSYDGLKRALRNERIIIEEVEERLGFITTRSLKPQPIPLDVKVILIGDPYLYQELYVLDMEFDELFKVKADFDTIMERTEENVSQYAAFICMLCQKENLKHLDGSGVAKLIEHSSRLAEDQQKLSTKFAEVADIIREASFYATQDNAEAISGAHVKKAIEEKVYRSKLVQEKIEEMIRRGVLLIDADAENVGQVNGLSVPSVCRRV